MVDVMEALYKTFYKHSEQPYAQGEFEENHRLLTEHLGKPECKLLLRIIDAKDLMEDNHIRESFLCGFRVAWQLMTQLYDDDSGHSIEEISHSADRCFLSEEKSSND